MNKILLACDGIRFPDGAFNFICQINKYRPVFLTGIFIPQISFAHLWSYATALAATGPVTLSEPDDAEKLQQNIQHFKELCIDNNIEFVVHKDYDDFALPELERESKFADLLLLSSERFYQDILSEASESYIEQLLRKADCPVLVVPEQFSFPSANLIAYDGSASATFAIKQFAYLFPELCLLDTTVVHASTKEGTPDFVEKELKELVLLHFPDANFEQIDLYDPQMLGTWVSEQKKILLICGAFSRSALSSILKPSFVQGVLTDHKIPVFIAHK